MFSALEFSCTRILEFELFFLVYWGVFRCSWLLNSLKHVDDLVSWWSLINVLPGLVMLLYVYLQALHTASCTG